MESKKINQLATELAPDLSDLTIIGDPTTGISKKITLSQMASLFTGTVEEYANLAAFPLVGVADTIYIALDTNILYRWNTGTSAYVELSPNIVSSLVFNDANGFDGTINLVGSVATLTITTALTTGSVGFIGASGALLQDNANFFWDDTNNRLGLGTNAPTTALDVFGSGIIGRLNGTSTNNAYLGFASAGTNKWSVGNVQSDHRFRIFSEANSAEIVSVLQTGEVGIGIANPTTKFHIDGAASALIANLDANVSVAKSISFRSDNSARINIEVSGTESGSNAGANFFIRRYSDAGSLIDTPLTILRSSGNIGIGTSSPEQILTVQYPYAKTDTTQRNIADFRSNDASNPFALTISSKGAASLSSRTIILQSADNNLTNGGNISLQAGGGNVGIGDTDTRNSKLLLFATGAAGVPHLMLVHSSAITLQREFYSDSSGNLLFSYWNGSARSTHLTLSTSGAASFIDDITITKASTASFIANNTSASGKSYRLLSGDDGKFKIQNTGVLDLVTITSTGSVGIGTSSPAYTLDVSGNVAATRFWVASGGNATDPMIRVKDDTDTGIFFPAANTMSFSTNANERMRILANGNVCIQDSFVDNGAKLCITSGSVAGMRIITDAGYNAISIGGTGVISVDYPGVGGGRFQVDANGNTYNRTGVYGTVSSDLRLKENIVDASSKLEDILKLRVVNFNLTNDLDKKKNIGFIAQELKQVFPSFVYESDTREYDEEGNLISGFEDAMGIKVGMEFAILVKAIQELKAEIEILKAK
jgi:hypothetical protein